MKILLISLLRLGDVILALPALAALRAKYPKAQIDILVNETTQSLAPLLNDVNHLRVFPRDLLQAGLGEVDRPVFESYDRLKVLIDSLNAEKFDLVINLTQNKLSGYLTAAIEAPEKNGMIMTPNQGAQFGSPWFRYLNDVVAGGATTIFHYADIFTFGISSEQSQPLPNIAETPRGRAELEEWLSQVGFRSGPKIVVQSTTSDKKKNWGEENWGRALKVFKTIRPDAQIILLGAPSETETINNLAAHCAANGIEVCKALLSLEGAFSLLNISDLLITGDTSIKHLANYTSARIVELSLGSSDYRKTGAYKKDSLIIRSTVSCGPCPHDRSCSRPQHDCALLLAPEVVGSIFNRFLDNDWISIKRIAAGVTDDCQFIRVLNGPSGFWQPLFLGSNKIELELASLLDRAAWKFLLKREHLEPVARYGSESISLVQYIEGLESRDKRKIIQIALDQIENDTQIKESTINKILTEISRRLREMGTLSDFDFLDNHLRTELQGVEADLGWGSIISEKMNVNVSAGILKARGLQSTLNDASKHQQIKLKLLRGIKNIITEKI